MKVVFEDVVKYKSEDGGRALIAEIEGKADPEDTNMFVRLQSWDDEHEVEDCKFLHEFARKLEGKRVRVTVEVI